MKDACYMLAEAWDWLENQSLKNAWNKLWPDLEGERDFNVEYREEITDFVQVIPECDEDVETWMACDAKDCGFQMLNDDEIVTSIQEDSDSVDMKRMKTRTTTTKVVREVDDLAKQINLEVDSVFVQKLLDSHNQELTMDELIEMCEQEQVMKIWVFRPSSFRRLNDSWEFDRRSQFN
ncbi:uncharacterized protein TNCV_1734111 [Trichonephila clavipes]|nr:uncharacterized protein TNCV_1734111 [Trichonephila clavipes]